MFQTPRGELGWAPDPGQPSDTEGEGAAFQIPGATVCSPSNSAFLLDELTQSGVILKAEFISYLFLPFP